MKKISLILLFLFSLTLNACNQGSNDSLDSFESVSESFESESTSSESISESESESESEFVPQTTNFNTPNPNAKKVSIKTLVDKGKTSDSKNLYSITGYVQFPYNYTFGNFDIVDETGSITVWGLSKNSTSMTNNGSSYTYSNDKTFSSIGLKAGDIITMEGIYVAYAPNPGYFVPEISGYIISKTTSDIAPITGLNYVGEETYSGTYYDSVNSLQGNELLKGLHNLMMSTHTTYVSYDSLKTTLKKSDPGSSSSNVTCFYSGQSTSSFNREHVWCQSLSGSTSSSSTNLYGTSHGGSDIHHIRPAISSYNSLRSNAAFGYVYGPKSGFKTINHVSGDKNYLSGNVIEPVDSIKGDVARIIMYMYMHYSKSIANDGSKYSFLGDMNVHYVMGPNQKATCFKLLREWNAIDPVDDFERNRNEVAYQYQGNRNPFIDHPSYADLIWG